MDNVLGSLIVEYKANVKNLVANSAIAKDVIAGVGDASMGMGIAVAAGVVTAGAAIIKFGVASTQIAAEYQQSMLKVQALTGSSAVQMAQYDSGLKNLAVDAGVAPQKLADGLYNVISAGYSGADALKVLTFATEDSKIGMTSAGIASTALTNVMANFKVGVSGASVVNGEMLQTVTAGKATFEQYANNITKAASTSVQFGQSMETMNAAWATLTANGISGGQATTDYDQSLKVMDGNIGTVSKSLNKNGIAFNEAKFNTMDYGHQVSYLSTRLQEANDKHVKITGATVQASQAIKTIADHIKMYNNDLGNFSNKQNDAAATTKAWAITQSGLNQTLSRVGAAVNVLMIGVGTALLPAMTSLGNALIPVMNNFGTLITAIMNGTSFFQQSSVGMDALKSALAGIGVAVLLFAVTQIPVMITALWGMAVAGWAAIVPLLPFILIGLAVALVIFGIVEAVKHWGAISTWLSGVWNTAVHAVGSFFSWLGEHIHGVLDGIGNFFHMVWNGIVDFLKVVGMVMLAVIIGPIGLAVIYIVTHWTQVKAFLAGIWADIVGVATSTWQRLTSGVSSALTGMWNWVTGFMSGLPGQMVQFGVNLVQGFINGIASMIGNVANAASGIANTVKSFLGFSSPAKMGPGSELNVWGPNMVKGFAQGVDKAAPLLQASMLALVKPMMGYPIVPSATGVAASVTPALASSNASTGEHTTIVELDSMELTRLVQKRTDQLVKLKLGPKGRVA